MINKECIHPDKAPKPAGPYSPAIKAGNLIFVSGQTPEKPGSDELVEGNIAAQTRQVFENIKNILAAAGLSMDNIVKVNAYLLNINDFDQYNRVYREYFSRPYPARTTVQCVIPGGSLLEVDITAVVE